MIRGQRVRRVVRRIDTWSVLRVAVLFYLSLMLVMVVAGVMLWAAGSVFGAVDSIEDFMRGIGFDGFEFVGGQLLRGFTAMGLIMVVMGTGGTVLMAVLYNLIADVVGGVQLTVLEEVYVPDDSRLPVTIDRSGEEWAVPATAPVEAVDTGTDTTIIDDRGEPAPAADVDAETVADPTPQPVAEPEPATVAEPEPQPVAEPEPATVAEPEPATVAEPEPQPVEEPSAHAETPPASDGSETSEERREESAHGRTTPAWQPATRSQWSDSSGAGPRS